MAEKNRESFEKIQNTIIGIDPGTNKTGYGIIEVQNSSYRAIDYGCIRVPTNYKLNDRYLILFDSLEQLLEKHLPGTLVIETQFVGINVQSALKLAMARIIAILTAKRKNMKVFEYTPMQAKRAVVGNGRASKEQVQKMIQHLLSLSKPPTPEDAADALSLAICHAQAEKFQMAVHGFYEGV